MRAGKGLAQEGANEEAHCNHRGAERDDARSAGNGGTRQPSPKVRSYTYSLDEVANNADGARGTVRLMALPNGKIQVKIRASGLAPNLPHAQHLHGLVNGDETGFVPGSCPTIANDGDLGRPTDGLIDTVEGVLDYGFVRQSLTTTGDTSSESALDVPDFPVADRNGNLRDRSLQPTRGSGQISVRLRWSSTAST